MRPFAYLPIIGATFQISVATKSTYFGIRFRRIILSQLNLLWGVKTFTTTNLKVQTKLLSKSMRLKENGWAEEGDMLINLAAMPVKDMGMVNTLRVSQL